MKNGDSMNLIFLREEEVDSDGTVKIYRDRAFELVCRHLIKVNSSYLAGVENKDIGIMEIHSASDSLIEGRFSATRKAPPKLPIDLIVGVSRPQTIKKVLHYSAMLGLSSITFVRTILGEKSYLKSNSLRRENIKKELILGLEQACDTALPKVFVSWSLEETLKNMKASHVPIRLLAHTENGDSVRKLTDKCLFPAIVALGPEMGWAEQEVDNFMRAGFEIINLGERILRVEVALVYLVGQISILANR